MDELEGELQAVDTLSPAKVVAELVQLLNIFCDIVNYLEYERGNPDMCPGTEANLEETAERERRNVLEKLQQPMALLGWLENLEPALCEELWSCLRSRRSARRPWVLRGTRLQVLPPADAGALGAAFGRACGDPALYAAGLIQILQWRDRSGGCFAASALAEIAGCCPEALRGHAAELCDAAARWFDEDNKDVAERGWWGDEDEDDSFDEDNEYERDLRAQCWADTAQRRATRAAAVEALERLAAHEALAPEEHIAYIQAPALDSLVEAREEFLTDDVEDFALQLERGNKGVVTSLEDGWLGVDFAKDPRLTHWIATDNIPKLRVVDATAHQYHEVAIRSSVALQSASAWVLFEQ
eukprot:NODE_5313_length_1785_cov_2.983112.p2 GENE.NODE_5313_length_1785_cov_2.983112~~NODE_5313_length_1785_cov_2.983112.p2  ORF type:complete len:355 (+),score=84.55 NODE_5313_length_1785_cov_2.983112:259-1323(+)